MLGETQVVHNLPKEIQDFKNTERRIVANCRILILSSQLFVLTLIYDSSVSKFVIHEPFPIYNLTLLQFVIHYLR